MAKSPKESPVTVQLPRITMQSVSALPAQLPALLSPLLNEGWQIISIVACRDSNDHIAYLSRLL